MDATRCLSYLTIELKGPVEPALRPAVHRQVFGCDICQDVCPWNRRAAFSADPAWQPRVPFEKPRLVALCAMSDTEWRGFLKGSALRRAGLRRLRRSLAYAAARLPAEAGAEALDALGTHESGKARDVADAIAWARAWIGRTG
jgi:epoxyqueuosine reductase